MDKSLQQSNKTQKEDIKIIDVNIQKSELVKLKKYIYWYKAVICTISDIKKIIWLNHIIYFFPTLKIMKTITSQDIPVDILFTEQIVILITQNNH